MIPARLLLAAALPLAITVPAQGSDSGGAPTCLGLPATVVRVAGDGHLEGTAKADVIVTGAGEDAIDGGGGNDTICSGPGDDLVAGGIGSDSIDSGPGDDFDEGDNGSDIVDAGSGRDTVLGNRGNDRLDGGAGGGDVVNGGLGDDVRVAGGSGNFDQLVGGRGNDRLYGGPGRGDALRGELGGDLYDGGSGDHDVASFALAGKNRIVGAIVDLAAGTTTSDGHDRLTGVEDVVGTPFHDVITGNSADNDLYGGGGGDELRAAGPKDRAFGGPGSDACEGFASVDSCGPEPTDRRNRVEVELAGGPAATALTVVSREPDVYPTFSEGGYTPEGFSVTVSYEPGAWLVEESPLPIVVGDRCALIAPSQARCPIAASPDAVFVNGSRADDRLAVDPSLPRHVTSFLQGEPGVDTLIGGKGDDVLTGGLNNTGRPDLDSLRGGGGDDSLTFGALLDGGAGSDLLIAFPCYSQTVRGGGGIDSVSFAHADGVTASLGGTAVHPAIPDLHRPPGCPAEWSGLPSRIDATVERIEGSPDDDLLIGDSGANLLLGRAGEDRLVGGGGGDILVGGTNRDRLAGGSGFDRLYGEDHTRDNGISCGAGAEGSAGIARLDHSDPLPENCLIRGTSEAPSR